jgi:hypothetical protein
MNRIYFVASIVFFASIRGLVSATTPIAFLPQGFLPFGGDAVSRAGSRRKHYYFLPKRNLRFFLIIYAIVHSTKEDLLNGND